MKKQGRTNKALVAIAILSALLIFAICVIVLNFMEIASQKEAYADLEEYMVYSYSYEHYDKGYAAGYADGVAGNRNIWG